MGREKRLLAAAIDFASLPAARKVRDASNTARGTWGPQAGSLLSHRSRMLWTSARISVAPVSATLGTAMADSLMIAAHSFAFAGSASAAGGHGAGRSGGPVRGVLDMPIEREP